MDRYLKKANRIRNIGTFSSFMLVALLTLAVFPLTHKENQAEAAYTPATSTLTIVSSKDTASVDITPASATGTFVVSGAADQAEFTVATTNLTGYSLNILGTDASGRLVNAITGDTLDTISSNTTESNFRTGSATTYKNKWGYRLSINNATTDFMVAPTASTAQTVNTTTTPNAPATSDNYTLGIGARVDYEKPYGTYTNTFILTAVGNPISYQINYLDNTGPGGTTGSDVSNLPASEGQSNITASAFTLSSTIPTRTGYDFVGWCYGTVSHTVDPSTCTGTTYQAGENFSFTSIPFTGTATANLYAMWEERFPEIQNLDSSLCTTTPIIVKDVRDGKKYTVARLADGQCWMTSDLNLSGGTKLYSETSNVPAGYPESGGTGYFTLPASSSSGFNSSTTAYVYNSGNETTNQADCYSGHPCNSYYSWLATTAGGKDASGNAVTSTGYNAAYSICPKGWRLPTATTSNASPTTSPNWKTGDFYKLATAYGANLESNYTESAATFYNNAGPGTTPNFLLAGRNSNNMFGNIGRDGYYWSSTSNTSTSAWYLLFYSSGVYSVDDDSRMLGLPVRCVMKTSPLYNTIADMSKGTQTAAELQAAITVPTSAARSLDTSNSGVYEYNSSVFGAATDAASTHKIYYYRGVLENSVSSYGSNGSAVTYPNYVKLGNTCWRILRTTGSGGVKMIYNGLYGATTAGSCANATTAAQFSSTSAFDKTANSNGKSIVGVGYTYNSSKKSTTASTQAGTLFGANSSDSNTTNSTIKSSIDTWYTSNLSSYTSNLEPSAGYCSDRRLATSSTATSWSDTTSIAKPYLSSGSTTGYYFASYVRNATTTLNPTLGCGRSTVDLYTTSSASNGNKKLTNPIALITADEASFVGSGRSDGTQGSSYHANSFLRSGSLFWLLSPCNRTTGGIAHVFRLASEGYVYGDYNIKDVSGVRPSISLSPGAIITSGTGIATDPWEVGW